MKKSLIALAVVAASGAAMAQSSVTVFGRVDASFGAEKNTVTGVSTTKLFNGSDAGLTGSRWGIRGVEDLGGGLKAVFNLENRFSVDTGADTGGFLGNAYVGLEGNFGALHLGRTYTAYDGVKALSVSNSVFDSAFTPNAVTGYQVRADNGVKYVSPTFAGVTLAASASMREDKSINAENITSLSAVYGAGPLKAGIAYENNVTANNTVVSAAYDFGVAAVSGGYTVMSGDGAGNDANGFNLGVAVPVGAFKFSVGYSSRDTETSAGAKVSKASGWGMGVTYSLSKRTTAYAGYSDVKNEDPAGVKLSTGNTRKYAVGLRHDF